MYTLIATANLNDIDPQAWLADVLARIADHPASRLAELLPLADPAQAVAARARRDDRTGPVQLRRWIPSARWLVRSGATGG